MHAPPTKDTKKSRPPLHRGRYTASYGLVGGAADGH
jgi:hypothetical protein